METSDLYRSGSSLSKNSSRNNTTENFSRSIRENDDEEDLKWAALERLPTYARLKKGLLVESQGATTEVDIRKLGNQEKKNLVERLVKVSEEDNEKFLLRLRGRIDKVGIEIPTIEVRVEDLNIDAKASVGSRAMPTVINFCLDIVEGFLNCLRILPNRQKHLSILHDVNGIIKPYRMTLLLGPPGSGKTTLLLALAGKLDPNLKTSGRVSYNGHSMHEFVPQRSAAYISQHDNHIAEMTVRETLAFSARCQGVGAAYELLAELARREKAANIKPDPDIDIYMKAAATEGQEENVVVDYILKVMGLEVCADTIVGNQMLRGISGGQRKRVTTGEMLVGPAKVLLMDEISTGLDSSTTFQVVNSLKHYVHILGGTAVISLLQPAPETYNLFDDIILISEGQIVYQGPREQVLVFFESFGFKCPDRKGVADFLQEVTSRKDQRQYWANEHEPYKFVTVKEFSEAFKSFHVGRKLGDELVTPFDKTKSHEAALTTKKYGITKKELMNACLSRELLLMRRNSFVYIFKACQLIMMPFIAMTIFLRTEMHRNSVTDGGIFLGVLFYYVNVILYSSFADLSMTIANLPVFYKQRDLLFHPAWAYALPSWILKIPISFLEMAIWVFPAYYVVGFDPNVGRLFKQFLLLFLMKQFASAFFRFTGAMSRNMIAGNTLAVFMIVVFFASGGFVLSRENVKSWWIWCYWLSPFMYIQNAVAVNELLGKSWRHVLPNSAEPLGVLVLKSRGLFPHEYWYWIGVGAMIGFTLLFNFLFILSLTYLNPLEKRKAIILEETFSNTHDGRTRDHTIQLTVQRNGSICRPNPREEGDGTWKRSPSDSSSMRTTAISEANRDNRKAGMILPFEQYSITFDDIRYSVDMPQAMKNQGVIEDRLELLKGVSGAFRPGVLTALMGVSGAGKTTLLDVLAGRKTGGYIEGNITISGYPKNQETFARISGYCEQNDIHSPNVTVYESLLYSAWLRLPAETDYKTRKMFVEEVMELVELTSLRESLVGLPGVSGLSTEQRKRLTIAVELVTNPSIIFMDEPTSGLDARAAAIVMRTVRNTVDTGRTVVCTIHQPSIDIFESFDELFLLKRGGEDIYVGPLGHQSRTVINYFQGVEGVSKIKDGYNPATWMLEVTTPAQEVALGINFHDAYRNSELYRRNKALIKELSKPPPGSKELYFPTHYSQPFFTQCMACLWKQHWSYWRNPWYTAVRLIFTAIIALLIGTMFWDLASKRKKQQDLFNTVGSIYAGVYFIGFLNASSVQAVVSVERTVFYRERAAGMYSSFPYALAQAAIELPYLLAQAILYSIIAYPMLGFEWTVAKFFWHLFFVYCSYLYSTFFGMMTVAVSPSPQFAAIFTSAVVGIWNLFTGYIVPRTRIPVWWRWNCWTCPIHWTLYGLVASQLGDVKDELDINVTVQDFIRNYYGFRHDFVGEVAVAAVAFAVLFALVFAFSIKMINFQKR